MAIIRIFEYIRVTLEQLDFLHLPFEAYFMFDGFIPVHVLMECFGQVIQCSLLSIKPFLCPIRELMADGKLA